LHNTNYIIKKNIQKYANEVKENFNLDNFKA
jgi:hypothetical protein